MATASGSSGWSTTRPVSPSAHRLGGAAAVAGDLGHAGGRGLEEHDAEALLLEAAPPVAAAHGEHVGAAVERGQVVVGHPAEEVAPAPVPSAARRRGGARVAAAPAMATPSRRPVRASRSAASISTSKPLRGTSRLTPTTSGDVGGQAEARAGRRPARRRRGDEAVDVDAGRDDDARQRPAGGALGLGGRVAAGGDDQLGARAAPARAAARAAGQAAGHGDLGAVEHDAVRAAQRAGRAARAAAPGRARRARRRSRRPGGRCGGAGRAWAAAPARATRTTGTAGGVPPAAPSYGRGEHGDVVGRQPPPQLPEVRLDAADLGREVVGDEEVLHAPARRAGSSDGRDVRGGRRPSAACSREQRRRRRRRVASRAAGAPTPGSVAVADVAEHDEGVAPQLARVAIGDVPAAVAVEQLVVGRRRAARAAAPTPRRRRAVAAGSGSRRRRGGWAGTPPGSRRSRRCGRRARRGARRGNDARLCTSQARQRRASTTPGATMAPGRAAVEAAPARAAAVGDRCRRRRRAARR